ncbi:trypsin-like peptidase domain-containing protein [Amaricoccus macauensis]|uniref:trypsin-like peptidase domain-containing protein n=1 Tax=Amaricoccus macauensis TaxID=57001 RepID=UPI003C7C8633
MPAILPRFILLLVLVACPAMAQERIVPEDQAQLTFSFAPVVQSTVPGVVNIFASRVVAQRVSPFADDPFFSQFFRNLDRGVPRVQNSLGSGVIVSPDGIVVSNYHVVGRATEIRVVLSDRREFEAEILLADENADLAIIRLLGAEDLPALPFADSDAAEVGDLVLAIGNPFGVGQTVSSGIVSGLARSGGRLADQAGYYIQTDAPINPGNSGGALVDMSGALLGINTSILTRSGGSNGIGFAIPSNLVQQYVGQAREGHESFRKPWAGIVVQQVEASLAAALGQTLPQGVVVADIHPESAFAEAGITLGDVILSVNGMPVNAPAELDFRLATLGPGSRAELVWLHDGQKVEGRISLAEAPDVPPASPIRLNTQNVFDGLTVATINPRLIEAEGLSLDSEGVIVLDVSGIARNSGLRPGDVLESVNGESLRTSADAERALRGGSRNWELALKRDNRILRIRLRG